MMKSYSLRKVFALAGLLAAGVMAHASMLDATISIDRAINSPTLTVRFSGATASMIELRLNGESIATRQLGSSASTGETNFTLDLSSLKDGDNTVEVRLFDKAGKIVGKEKTIISTDDNTPSPFFITSPKMGQTVKGPIELNVGFGQTFAGSYVSFFIDDQLKTLANTPPFTYLWDTNRETNGWHELQSWLVDDTNTTYKTKKIRVFVNNPSGHTTRHFVTKPVPVVQKPAPLDLTAKPNPANSSTSMHEFGVKAISGKGNGTPSGSHPTAIAPLESGTEKLNSTSAKLIGSPSNLKPTPKGNSFAIGLKHMTPTGQRYVLNAHPKAMQGSVIQHVVTASHLVPIVKGTRLPSLTSFSILMNDEYIDFDVAPRVDKGVPMTPLRYLLEKEGGKVDWLSATKSVSALADGNDIWLRIGDSTARINKLPVTMEMAPYLESSRTIVPLSFIRQALKVDVQYDKATGHVLITSLKK